MFRRRLRKQDATIDAILANADRLLPQPPPGFMNRMSRENELAELRMYVERHFRETGSLPTGRQEVPVFGMFDFGKGKKG